MLCCDEGSEGGEKGVKEVGEEIWKRTRRVFSDARVLALSACISVLWDFKGLAFRASS